MDASLTVTNGVTCTNTGSALVTVNSGNFATIFPMMYTLARDVDSNHIYNFSDSYVNGLDSTANTVPVSGLLPGSYSMVVGSQLGCDLTAFNFVILNCNALLPLRNPTGSNAPQSNAGPMMVFPNPVKDRCTLLVNAATSGNARVSVTDIYGKIVQAASYMLHSGKNECLLYTRQLPPGIYYIHLQEKASGIERITKIIKGS